MYHSLLTLEEEERIEKLQKMSLKLIFGFYKDYTTLLEKAGIRTLKDRREEAFNKFACSLVANDRYQDWFPLNNENGVNLRRKQTYREDYARTERRYNSPLYSMRRALNNM